MNNKYINPNEYGSLLYDDKEIKYTENVIKQRRIFRYSRTEYPYVSLCEDKIKDIVNTKYALCTTNGTSGLKTALVGAGVNKGDRVLISSYTFLATALAVIALGAIPIPIEVDLKEGLDLDDLNSEIKKGCKAVIVVHFQGRAFNISKIKKITKEKNIALIEDACQAFGASYKGKHAGAMSDIGVYSFQQFKQVSSGEGGCVVTNNEKYYNRMRNYTDMGSIRDRFPSWNSKDALFGENERMNNLVGAVLYAQLEKLNKMIDKQKKSREKIMNLIKNHNIKNIIESNDPDGDTSMNVLLKLKGIKEKEQAIELAKEKNIELRNMWSSLYYNNDLFIRNGLDSIKLKNYDCTKSFDLINKMVVMSIPPILKKKDEKELANLIISLKDNNLLE